MPELTEEEISQRWLSRQIFNIIDKLSGFRVHSSESDADNAFWKRPQKFLEELKKIEGIDITTELEKDYPFDVEIGKKRDLKQWKINIFKKLNPNIKCGLVMKTFGKDEFAGENKTELSVSGDCHIE